MFYCIGCNKLLKTEEEIKNDLCINCTNLMNSKNIGTYKED